MHSKKRDLYRPVVTGKGTTKEKRKPLAQGRLVSKPQDKEQHVATNQGVTMETELPLREDSSARCRRDLSSLVRPTEPSVDEPGSSPRRDLPQLSFHDSPRVVHPSHSLDVSDTESELLNASKKSLMDSPGCDVLVVDASQSSLHSSHSVEVAVAMGYANSPARVVCHSPGRVHSNLRNTGDVGLAAKVMVDRIPQVRIASEQPDRHSDDEEHEQHMCAANNPVIIRHSGEDEQQHTRPTVIHEPIGVQVTKPKVVQTLFKDDLSDSDISKQNKSASPLRENTLNWTEEDDCSSVSNVFDSRLSEISVQDKENQHAKSESLSGKSTKKKKAPRFVASRYMSGGGNSGMLAPKQSARGMLAPKPSAGMLVPKASTGMLAPKNTMKADKIVTGRVSMASGTNKTGNSSSTMTRKVAPARANTTKQQKNTQANEKQKSSTPTAESMGVDVSVNVSAIGPPSSRRIQSSLCASPSFESHDFLPGSGKKKAAMGRSPTPFKLTESQGGARKKKSDMTSSRIKSFNSTKGSVSSSQNKKTEHVTQAQLDLEYTRYIQMVFISARLENATTKQELHAAKQLHALWEENEKQMKKKEELSSQLSELKRMNNLDSALETQESGLQMLTPSLGRFTEEYGELADAVDTTQHQIPTRGVLIPQNQQQFQEELHEALCESEQLLGELSVLTRPYAAPTDQSASALSNMADTVGQEVKQLDRCQELMAATQTLSTQESSLQIQSMHACTS